MTAQISSPDRLSDTSLADFLRQVERRAAVLAELACGDPARGDQAVAATMRAFRNALARRSVASTPDPEWTTLFWSLLLAAPQMRRPADGHWPAQLAGLAALGRGVRAAMLLRLVAGLDDEQAARALGVAPAGWRLATLWTAVVRQVELRIQQLPPQRLVRLAALREQAVHGPAPTRAPRPRGWRVTMAAGAGACVLAFAATFLPRHGIDRDPRVVVTALPAAEAPASTYDADTALLTHRDFEQLADARNAALVRELEFYAWYAAQVAAADDATPMLMPDAARPLPAPPAGSPHASR